MFFQGDRVKVVGIPGGTYQNLKKKCRFQIGSKAYCGRNHVIFSIILLHYTFYTVIIYCYYFRVFAPAKSHGDNALEAVESYEEIMTLLNSTERLRNQTDDTAALVENLVSKIPCLLQSWS